MCNGYISIDIWWFRIFRCALKNIKDGSWHYNYHARNPRKLRRQRHYNQRTRIPPNADSDISPVLNPSENPQRLMPTTALCLAHPITPPYPDAGGNDDTLTPTAMAASHSAHPITPPLPTPTVSCSAHPITPRRRRRWQHRIQRTRLPPDADGDDHSKLQSK